MGPVFGYLFLRGTYRRCVAMETPRGVAKGLALGELFDLPVASEAHEGKVLLRCWQAHSWRT